MALKVGIVGARRTRQGTGPYVAREFKQAGCQVTAVVGTRAESAAAAVAELRSQYGIEAQPYTSLETMLEQQALDAVAICSPMEVHLEQLESCLRHPCHVLCEKPVWWRDSASLGELKEHEKDLRRLAEICEGFREREKVLAINEQWPFTLPFYWQLCPEIKGQELNSIGMRLSPKDEGPIMLIDSAPHLISLVRALLGEGQVLNPSFEIEGGGRASESSDPVSCQARFAYEHQQGLTQVTLELKRCPDQPRPAWYELNGVRVSREIELSSYRMFFVRDDRRLAIEDPLKLRVLDFIESLSRPKAADWRAPVDNMTALVALANAARGKF